MAADVRAMRCTPCQAALLRTPGTFTATGDAAFESQFVVGKSLVSVAAATTTTEPPTDGSALSGEGDEMETENAAENDPPFAENDSVAALVRHGSAALCPCVVLV